ncbi:MAG: zinc-dependent metalloprotease, partial [Acidobacteriaceae bacterium]
TEFKPGTDENAQHTALDKIIADSRAHGLRFLTDQDARPPGSPNPYTHLWDSGTNAVDELNRVLDVRARAMQRFGEAAIREGEPMALLEDVLVPIYMYDRYQVEAATKVIGGYDYTYALRGDGQTPTTPVPAAEQRRALAAVLKTIAPETLAIPDALAAIIPPHPEGFPRTRESFPTNTFGFDPIAAAQASAQEIIERLLDPTRAERLRQQKDFTLNEMLDQLIKATWQSNAVGENLAAVQRATADVALSELIRLASDEHASSGVRAMAMLKLHELRALAAQSLNSAATPQEKSHLLSAILQIRNLEEGTGQNPALKPRAPIEVPPGAPIGMTDNANDLTNDFSLPQAR